MRLFRKFAKRWKTRISERSCQRECPEAALSCSDGAVRPLVWKSSLPRSGPPRGIGHPAAGSRQRSAGKAATLVGGNVPPEGDRCGMLPMGMSGVS